MENLVQYFWQFNLEFSLLLVGILLVRHLVRTTTKNYNAYLLWVSIPLGVLITAAGKFVPADMKFQAETLSNVQAGVATVSNTAASTTFPLSELALTWAFVAVSLLIRLFLQHQNLRSELRAITVDQPIPFKSDYPLIAIKKAQFSPAVYGFLRPKIYFPVDLSNTLSSDQIDLIIQHEEHHIKQRHLWLNLTWDILVCLFWFNPFLYWSRQRFRHDQELYCDYLVLNNSNPHRQQSYGHALLSTISATHSVSLLCSWKTINHLEERIMNIKSSTSLLNKVVLSLCTLTIVGSASLYAMAGSHKEGEAKHVEKRVIMLEHDESADHEINIDMEGKQYVEKNGEKYIVENGKQRPMTAQEEKTFESHVAEARKHTKVVKHKKHITSSDDKSGHKVIKVIHTDDGESMSEEELAEFIEKAEAMADSALKEVNIELFEKEVEMASIEREMERAVKDLDAAYAEREISQKELAKAKKQIEKARAQIEADRARMEASIEQARKQTERVRENLSKDKRAY